MLDMQEIHISYRNDNYAFKSLMNGKFGLVPTTIKDRFEKMIGFGGLQRTNGTRVLTLQKDEGIAMTGHHFHDHSVRSLRRVQVHMFT